MHMEFYLIYTVILPGNGVIETSRRFFTAPSVNIKYHRTNLNSTSKELVILVEPEKQEPSAKL